jgi:hypothetical protein
MGIFSRARAYESLTPLERAVLRLVGGVALAGLLAAASAVSQLLGGVAPDRVNWVVVAQVALVAFVVGCCNAISKFYKAQGDPPLVMGGPEELTSFPPGGVAAPGSVRPGGG